MLKLKLKSRFGHGLRVGITLAFIAVMVTASPSNGAEILSQVLEEGQASLDVRYRFEWVDQEDKDRDANASTLRTRLGYKTGAYQGLTGFVELENVAVIGSERYNNTSNVKTKYPVVADPKDAEVNQAYLNFQSPADNALKVGRQRLILDNARFVGNVGWRQNEQTFDVV